MRNRLHMLISVQTIWPKSGSGSQIMDATSRNMTPWSQNMDAIFFFQSWEPLLWRDVVNKLYCRFSKTQRVIVKFIMKFRKSVTFISFHYKTFKLFWVNLKKNSKQDRIWDPDPTFGMQLWICFRFIFKKNQNRTVHLTQTANDSPANCLTLWCKFCGYKLWVNWLKWNDLHAHWCSFFASQGQWLTISILNVNVYLRPRQERWKHDQLSQV